MPNDLPKKPRFRSVIDLTSKAQEAAKAAANPPAPPETHDESAAGLDTSIDALSPTMQAAVRAAGWPGLMPVQARTLPYMQAGRDLIVQSKTGSGKTGAFLLPLFETLDPAKRGAKALVLTPTRELARQIYEEFLRLKGDRPEVAELDAVLVYGGVGYGEQTTGLKGGAQLVIGTPGRILDHLERRTLNLDGLKTLVLDEADEMLSMGFLPAMNKLRRYLPDRRQSTMFSATMPPTVRRLAETFLTEPTFIALAGGSVQVDQLAHRYYVVPGMGKDRTLVRLIELENPETAILFANTKREVEYLAQFLRNYGHDAGELSGDLSQSAREAIMQRLRDGNLRFLVATDVAARGIDISDLTHVIQYDVPQDPEYYVHRAGRTARAGKTGVSITLTTAEDKNKLLAIARRYELDFEERPLPTDEEVTARVGERLTTVLEDRYRDTRTLARERAARFDPLVKALAEEEPHLLSMLLDGLYHDGLHAQPQEELNQLAATRAQERRDRDDEERGRGPRGKRRSDEPRREERRERRPERSEERAEAHTDEQPEPRIDDALPAGRTPSDARAERAPARDRAAASDDAPQGRAPRAPRAPRAETPAAEHETPSARSADQDSSHENTDASAPNERRSRSRGRNRRRGSDSPSAEATDAPTATADDSSVMPDEAAAFEAVWAEPSAPEPMDVATPALDAIAPVLDGDDATPADAPAARSGRRGRGRGRDGAAATPEPNVAAPETGDDAHPEASQEDDAVQAPVAASPKQKAVRKPSGPFSVFDLRAMSDDALRSVGEDLLESVPGDRSELLFAILDAQAVQESAGRARRAKEAKPASKSSGRNGRRGERSSDRSSERPSDRTSKTDADKGDAGPVAPLSFGARQGTPRPARRPQGRGCQGRGPCRRRLVPHVVFAQAPPPQGRRPRADAARPRGHRHAVARRAVCQRAACRCVQEAVAVAQQEGRCGR